MKTTILALTALTLTGLALYSLAPESQQTPHLSMLKATKGFLYDQHVCGTNNLDFVSFTNDKQVKSRSSVNMHLVFKGQSAGSVNKMHLKVSKVIPLFSKDYNQSAQFEAGQEVDYSIKFAIPMIPISATVDIEATLYSDDGSEALKICAKLDV